MLTQTEIDSWESPIGIHLGHGTYIGPGHSATAIVDDEEVARLVPLKGKTAIAASSASDYTIVVQFDDLELREAYGWWEIPAKHFMFDLDLDE